MATITISRQFGSHGDTVAQLLCDRLGYRYFDKNLMTGLAVQAGLPAERLVDVSEDQHRARSLVERLFKNFASPLSDPATWAASSASEARQQLCVKRIEALIHAAHSQGDVVIIGRGGQAVLRGLPDVLHVRIIAPLELRIQRHAARAGLSLEQAQAIVSARDQSSSDYVQYYHSVNPADVTLYDLVINTGKVTPHLAADLITQVVGGLTPAH